METIQNLIGNKKSKGILGGKQMKVKIKNKRERGITLVALVITI